MLFGHKTEDRLQYVTVVVYEYRCNSSGVELRVKTKATRNRHEKEIFAQSRQANK